MRWNEETWPRKLAVVGGGVFLIRDSGELLEMSEAAYDSEAVLQELLAKYPNLLTGDAHNEGPPRRWVLVSRELSLTSVGGTSGAWSVDHLFLDQDGIPTLVEVKRSTNSEIRRSVVGQMLDYAANAVVYWPIERLRATFELNSEKEDADPEQRIAELVGGEADVEQFWQTVATNLQAQRVRLVFVADEIPPELARVIEFLNGQMRPAEVLGIEVKQYAGENLKTLVPRIVGRTEEAASRKTSGGGAGGSGLRDDWSWELYETELNIPAPRIAVGRKLLDEVEQAIATRQLPWRTKFRQGYVAIQRGSGYNVAVVDVLWRKVPRFAVKVPQSPGELELGNPYTQLAEDWYPSESEWGWTVSSVEEVPDVSTAIDLVRPFHPENGAMVVPGSPAGAATPTIA
ncbi:MAG TPA: hypothetical protein VJQ07_02135 [Gaiellaceae bacterium]|nr:hypothetical protein [Gaiellaceae bacterium]